MFRKEVKVYEKKEVYNIDLSEFSDLIDNMRTELKSKDLEYKKLADEYYKILKDFPNLQLIFEEQLELELSKEECKMLQKLVSIYINILSFEEKELFLLGCKNARLYNKNIEIIRD